MITLFAVGRSGSDIEPREYDRVTERCAFKQQGGREVRELRDQEYLHLFDTEAAAVDYVRARLERKLSNAQSGLSYAEAELKKFIAKYGVPASGMDELV